MAMCPLHYFALTQLNVGSNSFACLNISIIFPFFQQQINSTITHYIATIKNVIQNFNNAIKKIKEKPNQNKTP